MHTTRGQHSQPPTDTTFDPVTGQIGGSATDSSGTQEMSGQDNVEKPYVCRLCNIEQRFEQEFSLKCHLKLVHGQDPEVSSSAERDYTASLNDQGSHKHNGIDTEGDFDGPSPAKLPKLATETDIGDNRSGTASRRRGTRSRTPTSAPSGSENSDADSGINSRRSPRAKVQKQSSDDSASLLGGPKEKDTGAVSTENIRAGRLRVRKTSEAPTKTTTVTTDSQPQEPQPQPQPQPQQQLIKKTAKNVAAVAPTEENNVSVATAATNGRNSKKNTRAGRGSKK